LADPAVARVFQASNVAGGQGASADRQAAARDLMAANLDSVPFATFRNVTLANIVRDSGDVSKWDPAIFASAPKDLTDNYWIHIRAYPWASNAYADAGRSYMASYDMAHAWLSFDLGRAVDPDWRSGVMAATGALEDRLRQDQPDFF
jgi:hypothetical protein